MPLTAQNLAPAMKTALVYIAHLKALTDRVNVGANSRSKLLTIWSNLATTGANPLYAQLFLTRSVLKNDPVFDDPLGRYLSNPSILAQDHLLALQGALELTAEEVTAIFHDSGKDLATAELSLENASLLYRYRLLAKALKLTISDLIALIGVSGMNPLKPIKADPIQTIDDDYPLNQTLAFIDVAQRVRESGFRTEDLDYLLRHRCDPVGKYRPQPDSILRLVKTLAGGMRQIRSDNTIPVDLSSLTDEVLRQKLALALPQSVAETFLAMWAGTVEYVATQANVLQANRLDPDAFNQESAIHVSYDAVRQTQSLLFKGVVVDSKKAQLKATFPSPMMATLLDSVQAQAKAFYQAELAGFLSPADFNVIFAPLPDGLSVTESQNRIGQKRRTLAQAFLPFLQQRLTRQFVVQSLAANLNADPSLAEALLYGATIWMRERDNVDENPWPRRMNDCRWL